jgi:hypothetical protein
MNAAGGRGARAAGGRNRGRVKRWTAVRVAEVLPRMRELRAAGVGFAEIAQAVGMASSYVRWVLKHGDLEGFGAHKRSQVMCECGSAPEVGRRICLRCRLLEEGGHHCPPVRVGSCCVMDEYVVSVPARVGR